MIRCRNYVGFMGLSSRCITNEHPPPHFHVRYGSQKAKFSIEELEVTEGELSQRARAMVKEWAAKHQEELRRAWELASHLQPLFPIEPLE